MNKPNTAPEAEAPKHPPPPAFTRYQSTVRSPRGHYPGVFALANGLARSGALTEEQWRFWRAGNDWYDANYPDPSTVDPLVYDPDHNPGAVAWFKSSPEAEPLIARLSGYLELLTAHGVGWHELRSADPGSVVYEDAYQVVVVPYGPDAAQRGHTGTPWFEVDDGNRFFGRHLK